MDYTDHINGDGYDDERQNDNDVLRDDLVELFFFFRMIFIYLITHTGYYWSIPISC